MSITDELREWARDNTVQGEVLTTYPVQHPVHGTLESLVAIAERIETELAERYVVLPLDAGGEPIRVGDYVEETDTRLIGRAHGEVVRIVFGKHTTDVRIDTGLSYADRSPQSVRHITKKPTVEDVLREFASDIADVLGGDDFKLDGSDELFAEYAAKLRLAGE